jgi:hypothetical protein
MDSIARHVSQMVVQVFVFEVIVGLGNTGYAPVAFRQPPLFSSVMRQVHSISLSWCVQL